MGFNKIKTRDVIIVVSVVGFVSAALTMLEKKASVVDIGKTLPMVVFEDRDKLWQVVTYDDEPITAFVVDVYPTYTESLKKVYLNYRSQFVFSNGEPILLNGEPLFWNRNGDIVDYSYKHISESLVFYINDKGMAPGTAMTLKTLQMNLKSNVLREKDKLREKQLKDIMIKREG